MPVLRTGIDLVEISRLAELDTAIRRRFIARIFTEQEQAELGDNDASLSGRFAAKEAVAKALGTGIGPVHWQDIEILKGEAGEPMLFLHGAAAELARKIGLQTWSVSITHDRTHAAAVVVALGKAD